MSESRARRSSSSRAASSLARFTSAFSFRCASTSAEPLGLSSTRALLASEGASPTVDATEPSRSRRVGSVGSTTLTRFVLLPLALAPSAARMLLPAPAPLLLHGSAALGAVTQRDCCSLPFAAIPGALSESRLELLLFLFSRFLPASTPNGGDTSGDESVEREGDGAMPPLAPGRGGGARIEGGARGGGASGGGASGGGASRGGAIGGGASRGGAIGGGAIGGGVISGGAIGGGAIGGGAGAPGGLNMAARFAFMALRSGAAVSGSVGGGFSPGLPMTPPAPLTPDLSTVTVFFSDLPFLMASSRALRSAIALALAVHDTTRAPEERRTRGSERGAQ